ncbi:hypothetical protein CspeluHIS016_0600560 [Cutaneotrichosporon spelunceum]|uniref:CBM1 domain-containing protein n=1 Tax=Cutaneotrichosporon spelunceum TaxID=1672016 RepID=A0AAD3YE42_9TREE|nr:hypothetical protein CspeluHIS016_0600560 [Cutaneotrichosporon spelunceum]
MKLALILLALVIQTAGHHPRHDGRNRPRDVALWRRDVEIKPENPEVDPAPKPEPEAKEPQPKEHEAEHAPKPQVEPLEPLEPQAEVMADCGGWWGPSCWKRGEPASVDPAEPVAVECTQPVATQPAKHERGCGSWGPPLELWLELPLFLADRYTSLTLSSQRC